MKLSPCKRLPPNLSLSPVMKKVGILKHPIVGHRGKQKVTGLLYRQEMII